jgi:hypothetical protein
MSEPLQLDDELDLRSSWEPEEELPPRPRRRAVTPAAVGLAAALVAAGGFIGGVEVQKGQQGASSSSPAGSPAAGGGVGAFRGAQAGAAPTVGQVVSKRGDVLYVKDSSGTTIRVRTSTQSKVTRTAGSSVGGVHPGDTVLVQGTKRADGSITATQVRATAKGAAAAGGGGGFAGGAPGG